MRDMMLAAAGGGGLPYLALWLGGMFLILYLLYIRPQQRRQRAVNEMLSRLKRGDHVLTAGGMYGTVLGVKDDTVVLRIGDEGKAEFRRSAVVEVIEKGKSGD